MVGTETTGARKQLNAAADVLCASGYTPKAEIAPGLADDVIAKRVAGDAINLVVMGAYGHSRIRSLIIGSTTTEMIRSCKVPVMLFR